MRLRKVSTSAGSSQKAREEKALLPLELQENGSDSLCVSLQLSTRDRLSFGFKRVRDRVPTVIDHSPRQSCSGRPRSQKS